MATKKRKKTTTRRRRTMGANITLGARRRKRTTRRRKSGLSEMFSPSTATAATRSLGAAAIGGVLAAQVSRMLAKQPTYTRVTASVIASFLTYAVGGYPSMAAGMAGGFAATESEPMLAKMLNDDDDGNEYDYADANALNEMPVYLNEDGEAIYLNEDDEMELAEEIYLNEDDSIYPAYATEY
jgi:hypothetical protein